MSNCELNPQSSYNSTSLIVSIIHRNEIAWWNYGQIVVTIVVCQCYLSANRTLSTSQLPTFYMRYSLSPFKVKNGCSNMSRKPLAPAYLANMTPHQRINEGSNVLANSINNFLTNNIKLRISIITVVAQRSHKLRQKPQHYHKSDTKFSSREGRKQPETRRNSSQSPWMTCLSKFTSLSLRWLFISA